MAEMVSKHAFQVDWTPNPNSQADLAEPPGFFHAADKIQLDSSRLMRMWGDVYRQPSSGSVPQPTRACHGRLDGATLGPKTRGCHSHFSCARALGYDLAAYHALCVIHQANLVRRCVASGRYQANTGI